MISVPILSWLLGGEDEEESSPQVEVEAPRRRDIFRIDPTMRYYLISDLHLDPEPGNTPPPLLKLLRRLYQEGGIGGLFLLGDLARRPGIRYAELERAHPELFELLYRLTLLSPVVLVQGECDLNLEPPAHLAVTDRFEDDHWLFVHGHQFDPAVSVSPGHGGEPRVERGQPDVAAALAGLRELKAGDPRHIVFGHVHRAGYVEPGLTCLGHWTGRAADYGIIREGQIFLSSSGPFRRS